MANQVTEPVALDKTLQKVANKLGEIRNVLGERHSGTIYGFHIDSSESDPETAVTYLEDASGFSPAYMDFTNGRFVWGSWANAFFLPKPCMLKYDGTVDYYLDPNNYAYKEDGSASDVADTSYGGNAMMEWGQNGKKIWHKIVPDSADATSVSVYIADFQVDEDYHAWAFINNQGEYVDHFYTPIYNGAIVNDGEKDVLRSISGIAGSSLCKSKTAAVERTMAKNNNPDLDIWDTEVYCDIILIQLLLTLMSKSLQSQTAFGQGLHSSGNETVNNGFTTGVHDAKGLFWGTNSGAAATYANAVKVFGMENFWGFQWRRFAGLVNVNGTLKYKLTKGMQDGSEASDYVVSTTAADYAGYLEGGALPSASGSYIKKQEWSEDVPTPTDVSGSASTYYCDAMWTNLSAVCYAVRGGTSNSGALVGLWCLGLGTHAGGAGWAVAAAPSCKPPS